MNLGDLLGVAAPYGPLGLFCLYLAWREYLRDKREEKREESGNAIRQEQVKADKELACALTLLAERIGGRV